jgi:hypothetical protein
VLPNPCGTQSYKLKLTDGTYLDTTIARITSIAGSNSNTISVTPVSLSAVDVYTVTIEGTMTFGSTTKVTNSPSFTITINACNSCPLTTLNAPVDPANIPTDYSIGVDGIEGMTYFDNFEDTVS